MKLVLSGAMLALPPLVGVIVAPKIMGLLALGGVAAAGVWLWLYCVVVFIEELETRRWG